MSRAAELARIIVDSHATRSGRMPPLVPMHNGAGNRTRVTALELSLRMKRRRVVWTFDEVLAALEELQQRGVVFRGEGGFAVVSLEALHEAAKGELAA